MGISHNIDKIIADFNNVRPTYLKFTAKIETLIIDQLKDKVKDAFTKSRTKDEASFLEKLTRPGKSYENPLKDVTDMSGIRIIVYYRSQIEEVEKFIDREFNVDKQKSRDASESLAENAFGYLSLHKIVTINSKKARDPEWREFVGLYAEIQIRTSLQDAWATISHNSQYKVESLIPVALRRKISMLAGIFELSDDQFLLIKQESERLKNEYARKKHGGEKNMPIDYESLVQFFSSSAIIIGMMHFANSLNTFEINKDLLSHYGKADAYLVAEECKRLSINTIGDLENLLESINDKYQSFLIDISQDRIWRATDSFVVFLLIMLAYPKSFDEKYLVENYGWDYGFASNLILHLKRY